MMDNFNPADGTHIATIPRASAADVDAAVLSAKKALPQWSALTILERAAVSYTHLTLPTILLV